MKYSREMAFLAVLLLLSLIGVTVSSYWREFAYKPQELGVGLISFDKRISSGESCFKLLFEPIEFGEGKLIEVMAVSDEELLLNESILVKERMVKGYCFNSGKLEEGENLVEVIAGGNKLFYHLVKEEGIEEGKSSIEIISLTGEELRFKVNSSGNRFEPVEIFVNGELERRVYPEGGEEEFIERIDLKEGINEVRVVFFGKEDSESITVEERFRMHPIAGLIIIFIALFVFSGFVFSSKGFIEKMTLSFASLFVLIIINGFVLNHLNLLNLFSFIILLIAELIVLIALFRKRFRLSYENKFIRGFSSLEVTVLLFILFVAVFFHLFSVNHFTNFSVFYDRQAAMVAENFGVPSIDALSYLGRGFSFVPGYFFLNAGLSWITGLSEGGLFAFILLIGNFFFFFSVYFLIDALGFRKELRAVAFILLVGNLFIFPDTTFTPRHLFSLAFLLIALGLLIKNRDHWFAGLLLGITSFIQIPLLLGFVFTYPLISRKIEWKHFMKTIIIGFVVFGALFLPNLLLFGQPYEIRADQWGYLVKLPLELSLLEEGLTLFFISVMLSFDVWDKIRGRKLNYDSYRKKLLFAIIISVAVQLFITWRWNIFSSFIIALFILTYFNARDSFNELIARMFSLILLIILVISLLLVPGITVPDSVVQPINFLKENSSSNSRILADPLYGHNVAFFGERTVLADLYVEYADEVMLSDSFLFLKEKDYSILEKYGIDYVLNQNNLINERITGNPETAEPIEFREMDKVYASSTVFIHKKRVLRE